MLEDGPANRRVVDAEDECAGALVCQRAHLRIVAVDDERSASLAWPARPAPTLRDVLELAVAIELVAKEVAETDRLRPDARENFREGRLVDLEEAEVGARASSSVEATPERRFAPELLWARRNRPRRIEAAIAAVVVFPFVAEMTADPSGKRRGEPVDGAGIELPDSLPGTVVPPPAPRRRERRPAARATSDLRGERNRRSATRKEAIRAAPIPRTGELPRPYHERVRSFATSRPTLRCVHCGFERRRMRTGGHRRDVRASALWGSGKRGTGSRSNALWGNGKRRTALLATLVLTLVVPLGASAVPGPKAVQAFVAPGLLTSAQSQPTDTFSVIVQGKGGNQAAHAVADVLGISMKVAKTFNSIDGVAIDLTGTQILALAGDKHVTAITPDARMRLSAAFSPEKWPYVTGVQKYWAHGVSPAAPAATIAIVDSGIDASRPEFAGRIAATSTSARCPVTHRATAADTAPSWPAWLRATWRQEAALLRAPSSCRST